MVRIRLQRTGRSNKPTYRVVVADQRSPRDGRFIERIGHVIPTGTKEVQIEMDRYNYWLEQGAQPTVRVKRLVDSLDKK